MIADNLIKRALRKIGALPSGSEMEPSEGLEALEGLKELYRSLTTGAFGVQRDVHLDAGAEYQAWPGDRIVCEDYATNVIELPLLISDTNYKYDYGWGPFLAWACPGLPDDFSVITINDRTDPAIRFVWVYDNATANWTDIEDIHLADEAPFSLRIGDGLAAMLAINIAPEYGAEAVAMSERRSIQNAARDARVAITQKFSTRRRPATGVFV